MVGRPAKGFVPGAAFGGGGGSRMGSPAFRVYGEQSAERRAVHDWQIRPVLNVMGKVVHIDCFCIQGMTEAGNKVMATLRGAIEDAVLLGDG